MATRPLADRAIDAVNTQTTLMGLLSVVQQVLEAEGTLELTQPTIGGLARIVALAHDALTNTSFVSKKDQANA